MGGKEIIFTSDIDGYYELESSRPQPAKNFIPSWYKDGPMHIIDKDMGDHNPISKLIFPFKTYKVCPSFTEVFNEGYVLVAPCDMWFSLRPEQIQCRASNEKFRVSLHNNNQYVNHLPKGHNVKYLFSLDTGWKCITPKGYSIRYVPLFYNYNPDWHSPYGVVQTDKLHTLNVQLHFTTDKDEILIRQGEPLCYIIPYKREKYNYKFKKPTPKLRSKIQLAEFKVFSKFKSGYLRNS